jgi:AraC family transcriptional activator of pobA
MSDVTDRTRPALRPASRRAFATLPAFTLYGEVGARGVALLHIESIDSRSRPHNWEIDAHVHRGLHQVLWLRSGKVDALLDESRSRHKGPVVHVIPPGVPHAFSFSPGSDGYVLTVNANLLAEGDAAGVGESLQELFASPHTIALDATASEVARLQPLFEALHAENQAADSADGPVPRWLARAVVWRLAQLVQRAQLSGESRAGVGRQLLYARWVVLLESHYLDHWPVSRYADRLGLSTERLNRMVRAETGDNAQALLHARLTREACRRLVHVAAPISRLAFELGFEDPAYFCRFFKRHTGLSPRAYQEHALRPLEGEPPGS